MLYGGVDYHKRYSQVTVMDERGQIKRSARLANEPEEFQRLLEELGEPCELALEAGRNWGLLYDWLEGKAEQVHLVHPLKVKAIAWAKIKTDAIDSCTLAHLLRADLLPTAHIPSPGTRRLKELLRQRIFLVTVRTMVKNRIHNLCDRNHLGTERFSDLFGKLGREFLERASERLPESEARLLRQDLELLEELTGQIRVSEGWLAEASRMDERAAWLQSLPGIGQFLALVILAEIDTIARFPNAAKLASYAGLVPSTRASGGRVWHGRITKSGNKYLRWALVEAVWPGIRKSVWLRSYYQRIKMRHGVNTAKVATARKLAGLVWTILRERRPYEERRPRVALCSS